MSSRPARWRALRGVVLPLLIALLLAACGAGGGSTTSGAPAACAKADASGAIKLTAKDISFSSPCMQGPANSPLTIEFTNADGMPHDVAVYTNSSKSQELFRGELVTGPGKTVTYKLPPLKPGSYFYECTEHPSMTGTLTIT